MGLDVEARVGHHVRVLDAKLARFVEPTGRIVEIRSEGERVRVEHDGEEGALRYYNTGKNGEFDLVWLPDERELPTFAASAETTPRSRRSDVVAASAGGAAAAKPTAGYGGDKATTSGSRSRGFLPPAPEVHPDVHDEEDLVSTLGSSELRRGGHTQHGVQSTAGDNASAASAPRSSYAERRKARATVALVEEVEEGCASAPLPATASPSPAAPSSRRSSVHLEEATALEQEQPFSTEGAAPGAGARMTYAAMRKSRVSTAALGFAPAEHEHVPAEAQPPSIEGLHELRRLLESLREDVGAARNEAQGSSTAASNASAIAARAVADLRDETRRELDDMEGRLRKANEAAIESSVQLRSRLETLEQASVAREAASARELDALRQDLRRQSEALEQRLAASLMQEVDKHIQASIVSATEKLMGSAGGRIKSGVGSPTAIGDTGGGAPEPEQESHPGDDTPPGYSDAADRAERAKRAAAEAAASWQAAEAAAEAAAGAPPPVSVRGSRSSPSETEASRPRQSQTAPRRRLEDMSGAARRLCAAMEAGERAGASAQGMARQSAMERPPPQQHLAAQEPNEDFHAYWQQSSAQQQVQPQLQQQQ